MSRESMQYDVVIVGGGPAGLACAIRLRQLASASGHELSVCVIEKGSEVGAHILSGAVFEPRALDELLPDWRERGAPLNTPVSDDHFLLLTQKRSVALPVPPSLHNKGNYIISLANLCRWLGSEAEAAGVDVFAGFSGAEILYDEHGAVRGVATGDMGVDRQGEHTGNYQPGMELHARVTIIAEGCRGSLARELMERYSLRQGVGPQTYGLGIKELWEIDPARHRAGTVLHTMGWPLDSATYGGSFLYHQEGNQVAIGLVVGLGYRNPHLSPFEEFQRLKTHPALRDTFAGGRRIAYGARAISAGGYQAIPRLDFPGGLLIGDSAGFLNFAKIKGSHSAMKSGMVAAEAVHAALSDAGEATRSGAAVQVTDYRARLDASWLMPELHAVRNIKPAFRFGLWAGLAHAALDTQLLRGRVPWTLGHHADHEQLLPAASCTPIDYPRPDGVLTFDRLSSVFISNTNHEENQPCHLQLRDDTVPVALNRVRYDGPEARYCPAGVYEFVTDAEGGERLQINAQNCVHCKTCDIKDPTQNIRWVVPQGGDGPNYPNM